MIARRLRLAMMSKSNASGARTRARELMVQALYQKQLAGHSTSELIAQFHQQHAYERVDQVFFDEHFPLICKSEEALKETIGEVIDRPVEQLDPIELAILMIGIYELQQCIETPFRVVINEAINLAKRFASIEGHKYINACLDAAAKELRTVEFNAKQ